MHRTFSADGLVCLSLSTDKKEDSDKALAFLGQQGATFPNFRLADADEAKKQWKERYPVNSQPILMVFDRTGARVKDFFGDEPAAEVDAFVKGLLAAK